MPLVSSLVAFASQKMPRMSSRVLASSGYTLDLSTFGRDAFRVWTAETAERQERAWRPIVERAKAGHPREDVAALFEALEFTKGTPTTLLEVGCGGGYNSELIEHAYPEIECAGVDISDAMVEIARGKYPHRSFSVGSAYALDMPDSGKDIVLDGVALLHMLEWKTAVAEYARVARKAVVLHGLTLSEEPTTVFGKYAYGQPSMELVFNRTELLAECSANGLHLKAVHGGLDYDLAEYIGIPSVSETWVLTT